MNEKLTQQDLEIIAERQAYIVSQEQHLASMRSHQTHWISLARASGATWPALAQVLGVSPQAVQERLQKWTEQQQATGATLTDE